MPATIHDLRQPDRPPAAPHNIEAEQAVLGAILVNNTAADRCAFLRPEDFIEPVHGRILTAMRREMAAGRRADPVTLGPLFDTDASLAEMGGRRYLAELCQRAESIGTATEYARKVRTLARRRRLAQAARDAADQAEDTSSPADASEILAEFLPRLEAEGRDDTRRAGQTLAEVASDIADDLLNPPEMFSTGVPLLDEAIGGSVPFGYVVGFEARPAGFKTGVLHTLALNVALAGVPACYLAAEMGAKRLARRMLGHLGGFKSQWFRHPSEDLVRTLGRVSRELPASLVIEDCPGITFSRLKQIASEQLTARGCRVFFLDYFQLVGPDGRCDSRSQHLEEIAYWLQAFAYRHNATWFVASQQNRDGHTLGSDGLLRASDWLCQINKHERRYVLPQWGEVETLWFDVRKARDGGGDPIGSAEEPRLMIHPHGPHLAELPA